MSYPASGFDAGRYVIAFNGAVYNYRELRDELEARHGATFATDGDTEVVVAAYHHWGEQAATRLRGMFAVVIYDTHRGMVWGARDPYGIKPLYYLVTDDGLYFASEKKALLPFYPGTANDAGSASAIDADAAIDTASLSYYLTLQYVPEPATLHRGIGRVGGGESFSYLPGGTFATRRYYQPAFRPTATDDPAALYRRIRDVLRESVHAHLRADVPVGAFLSSGIDSTAIVAFAREVYPEIPTFTVGFAVEGYSEIGIAEDSAHHLGVRVLPTRVTADRRDGGVADRSSGTWTTRWPIRPSYRCISSPAPRPRMSRSRCPVRGPTSSSAGTASTANRCRCRRSPRLPDSMQRGLRKVASVLPAGRQGPQLSRTRHDADRGALLRQCAHLHRGAEAGADAALRRHRCATRT